MFQACAILLSPTACSPTTTATTTSKLLAAAAASSSSDPYPGGSSEFDARIGSLSRKGSYQQQQGSSSSGLGVNSSILNRMSGMGYNGSGGGGTSVSGTSGHSTLSITNRSSNSATGSTANVLFGGYSYNFDKQKLLKDYLKSK